MIFLLRQRWWLGILALALWQGCGEPRPPITYGPNLVINSSFESGLDGWWKATDSMGGEASTGPEAADLGSAGLMLYKGTGGWGSMVGQETQGHVAMQTFQVQARLRGVVGGERVTFSFHGEGVEVVAEPRWRTVSRMVLMPELNGNASALISVTTDEATVHVDDVSFTWVEVERGDADQEEDNLVRNGSFESDLGLWSFWTDSPEGAAYTTPEERHSGYAGMVMTRGPEGSIASVKQSLLEPVSAREEYRIEARIRGASGGEQVNLCLQINHEPWSGPCVHVKATQDWQHLSADLPIDEALIEERVGALVSLGSEGTVFVDDVIVVRKK
ncbi:carbohydrate binding domain-containing protein [Hyalangium sp.]|uniref:carbohydrate binding domain-containing protein n=1 Tax=Hyalangium sp. TaxID=2028555 RepID=UPI002D31166E|nr:carbohydrate binding domain-containing protein [Hyalangium sp.]HYI01225.1 carbohydrate binding domain-containing protein [Hyalangium sp.]